MGSSSSILRLLLLLLKLFDKVLLDFSLRLSQLLRGIRVTDQLIELVQVLLEHCLDPCELIRVLSLDSCEVLDLLDIALLPGFRMVL